MSRRRFLKQVAAGIGGLGVFSGGYVLRDRTTDRPSEPVHVRDGSVGAADRGREQADAPTPVEGAYYVAPDGDDSNAGSRDAPFATLQRAVDAMGVGDTTYLRGGIYRRERSIRIADVGGNADEPVTIAGYPNERPVFRFAGPLPGGWDRHGGITFSNVTYLTVRNLVVRNSPNVGIEVTDSSTNNRFRDITVINNNLGGFGAYDGSSNNVFRNIAAANNYDPQNEGENADGLALSNTENNVVRNGRFFYNSDDGLDLWNSRSIDVRGCVSWSNGRGESGGGNGFKLGGDGKSGGHYVARNVAYLNRASGFMYNTATIPMRVVNNTAWRNRYNYSFYTVEHRLVNNIGQHGKVALGPAVSSAHNTWNLDIANPEFASYHPDEPSFLHLSPNSPCIGAGTDVDLEYTGDAPDLGAYEYTPPESG